MPVASSVRWCLTEKKPQWNFAMLTINVAFAHPTSLTFFKKIVDHTQSICVIHLGFCNIIYWIVLSLVCRRFFCRCCWNFYLPKAQCINMKMVIVRKWYVLSRQIINLIAFYIVCVHAWYHFNFDSSDLQLSTIWQSSTTQSTRFTWKQI